MRRFFLTLACALLAAPAAAQVPFPAGPTNQSSLALVAPTPPTTANNDQVATTAYVQNVLLGGLPLASGKIYIGSVGNIATAQTPSGDLTVSVGGVFTLATVNANVGSFGSTTQCATITTNAKGLITAASAATCAPAIGSVTGLGTGIATWLGTPSSANLRAALTDETGTGLAYFQGGDIGTPSAGVGTNLTALNASNLGSGTIPAARMPALTGDVTMTAGTTAATLAAGNAGNLNSGTLLPARTNGHMNGTATNDSAAAGEVGEYVTSTGGSVAAASGTQVNATSMSLTAGDWDVTCSIIFNYAATTTAQSLAAGVSTTSATLGSVGSLSSFNFGGTSIAPNGNFTIASPTTRVSVASTTTTYCVGVTSYSTSTASINSSFLRARRAR